MPSSSTFADSIKPSPLLSVLRACAHAPSFPSNTLAQHLREEDTWPLTLWRSRYSVPGFGFWRELSIRCFARPMLLIASCLSNAANLHNELSRIAPQASHQLRRACEIMWRLIIRDFTENSAAESFSIATSKLALHVALS